MADPAALVGTWKMVSWTREVIATGEISDAMGPNPIGYIAYHADGRMIALVVRRDRPPLSGKTPTDEEKVRLYDTMLAYSATYTLEDDRVAHHVDAAWNPAWTGTDLIRPFRLDGDTLVISGAPSKDPATGEDVIPIPL
jgi:Lipocalin-like domain